MPKAKYMKPRVDTILCHHCKKEASIIKVSRKGHHVFECKDCRVIFASDKYYEDS